MSVSCLSSDDEEKGKLPWLWADAGCSASWWGVGPPVSGSPRLPLLCCGESDRWSPEVLLQSQRCFFSLSSSLQPPVPGQRARGTWRPGPTPSPPPPQGSTAYREGSPCRLFSPTNPLLPPRGCKKQLHLHSEVLFLHADKTCGSFFTEIERGRAAELNMLYILM